MLQARPDEQCEHKREPSRRLSPVQTSHARRARSNPASRYEVAAKMRVSRSQPKRGVGAEVTIAVVVASHPRWACVVCFENNVPRVRDGYITPSAGGHTRALLATRLRGPICRTNVLANDRTCTPLPPQNLHGKEGVDGSSPSEGFPPNRVANAGSGYAASASSRTISSPIASFVPFVPDHRCHGRARRSAQRVAGTVDLLRVHLERHAPEVCPIWLITNAGDARYFLGHPRPTSRARHRRRLVVGALRHSRRVRSGSVKWALQADFGEELVRHASAAGRSDPSATTDHFPPPS